MTIKAHLHKNTYNEIKDIGVGCAPGNYAGKYIDGLDIGNEVQMWILNSNQDGETQRWKLDNNKKLENKGGVWKSDDLWIFKTNDNDLIYIENTSKTKVLQATSDGKAILEVFEEGKPEQLWKKGNPDAKDYFTLESHSKVPKVITAISESGLEIKDKQNDASDALCLTHVYLKTSNTNGDTRSLQCRYNNRADFAVYFQGSEKNGLPMICS